MRVVVGVVVDSKNNNDESIMKWFNDGIGEGGENGIVIYPNLQTFRQIYTQYVKDRLTAKELEEENRRLKKMYAEERLKAEILKEAIEKKW